MKIISILLIFLLLISCGHDNKKSNKNEEGRLIKKPTENFKLNINHADTLGKENEIGNISYKNKLPDTTKIDKEDVRILTVYVNVFKGLDNPSVVQESSLDTFVAISRGTNLNKEIICDFFIKKENYVGLNFIRGKVVDQVFLNSYTDSSKIRLLEETFFFEKPVYIKDQ